MRNIYRFALPAVAGLMLTASLAAAQEDGQRGGRGRGFGGPGAGRGVSETQLLGLEQVQKELELVDEQKEEVGKLVEELRTQMREAFSGLRELSEEDRRARFAEIREKSEAQAAELRKKLDNILLPHQRERLSQIALQIGGEAALARNEIAEKLGITDDQKEQLAKVRESLGEKFREAAAGFRDESTREAAREKMAKLREEAREQILAVFSADQKAKLEELRGEPFEFDRSQLFQRRGRGNRDNN